jgi:hypothetical protein
MDEASLFVFVDDDTTSCIIVTNCDNEKARTMVGRALAHASAPPIKYYNADEYAAAFVAANKRRPFDMLFVGPYDDVRNREAQQLDLRVACRHKWRRRPRNLGISQPNYALNIMHVRAGVNARRCYAHTHPKSFQEP